MQKSEVFFIFKIYCNFLRKIVVASPQFSQSNSFLREAELYNAIYIAATDTV
jgi:hypothetical protein